MVGEKKNTQRSAHCQRNNGLLHVQTVFGFIINDRVGAVDHTVGDFDVAVSRQTMHVDGVGLGQAHAPFVGDPVRVLLADVSALGVVGGCQQSTPALGVDNVGILEAGIEIIKLLEAAAKSAHVVLGLL